MAVISTAEAVSALPTTAPFSARARVLSPGAAFLLLVSILVSFFASSSVPSPLYPVYQAQWGFSPITVTVVFGVYALAVLAALLVVGRLSDWVGRRPVLIGSTALQAATMLLFATAGGLSSLLAARIIQGLATGAAAGALGAGLLDLDREKGTIAGAVAPMLGTATGGIVSGLMVAYLPAPTHLVYLVLFAVLALQVIGVVLMPESSLARRGALASLRPQLRVPPAARQPLLLAAPALVASWALAGFYLSLGPTLVRRIVGSTSLALGGLAILAMAGSGGLAVLLLRARPARDLMTFGATALVAGVGATLIAVGRGSAAAFFVGTALSGAGFGTAFQGAMRAVLPLATAHERAGVLSVLYIVSYLAFGLPAVLGGVGVVYGAGLVPTAREYGVAVMVLAAMALVGTVRRYGTTRTATSVVYAVPSEPVTVKANDDVP